MSTRKRMLFFLTAWLIVLMPFLFWWSTWFGRHLTDQQITEYLSDRSIRDTSSMHLYNWVSAWAVTTRVPRAGILTSCAWPPTP